MPRCFRSPGLRFVGSDGEGLRPAWDRRRGRSKPAGSGHVTVFVEVDSSEEALRNAERLRGGAIADPAERRTERAP